MRRTMSVFGIPVVPIREHVQCGGSVSFYDRCGRRIILHDGDVCRASTSDEHQDVEPLNGSFSLDNFFTVFSRRRRASGPFVTLMKVLRGGADSFL